MQNPGRVISRYDFSEAWDESMTIKNIKSGFRIIGICPFDKDAIHLPGEERLEEFNPHSLPKQTGLKYIPLYSSSPIPRRNRSPSVPLRDDTLSDDNENSAAIIIIRVPFRWLQRISALAPSPK